MNEHEPTPMTFGPERMQRAANRYRDWITEGLTAAQTEHREIDLMTARLIAHTLSRSTGRTSALGDFGRVGEGDYEALRDEYLPLYTDPTTPIAVREWIDWFGTYLIARDNLDPSMGHLDVGLPPKLERLLVRTDIKVEGEPFTVHVAANHPRADIDELESTLEDLGITGDEALQAFLTLPDVDALDPGLATSYTENHIGTFYRFEDAIDNLLEVDEWAKDITDYANERGFVIDGLTPDYDALTERAEDAYDLVEWKGKTHAFYK